MSLFIIIIIRLLSHLFLYVERDCFSILHQELTAGSANQPLMFKDHFVPVAVKMS